MSWGWKAGLDYLGLDQASEGVLGSPGLDWALVEDLGLGFLGSLEDSTEDLRFPGLFQASGKKPGFRDLQAPAGDLGSDFLGLFQASAQDLGFLGLNPTSEMHPGFPGLNQTSENPLVFLGPDQASARDLSSSPL